nr:NTP transferase domain-containing protein [Saprospiraceae bacterium]
MQNITAIIPARYASTRFPGKPLVDIQGKTMLQRVFEQVAKASSIHQIYVATDDERIFNHVINFGGNVILTDANHISGTDRCAEVAKQLNTDIIINVQGDEPFIQPQQIDDLANMMLNTKAQIGTQIKQITKAEMLFNTNVV